MSRPSTVVAFAVVLAARAAFGAGAAPAKAPPAQPPPATAPVVAAATASPATGATAAGAATTADAPSVMTAAPAAAAPSAPAAAAGPTSTTLKTSAPSGVTTSQRQAGALRDPAPRPPTDVRVQSRFAVKAKSAQVFGGAEYLSRGDFYNSPGARVGATYYPVEAIGLELQVSHYWSSLNAEAERVKKSAGLIPNSHAPSWLMLLGGRYSIGYGKLLIGGLGGAIHFEPQAFLHAGMHAHDGDVGPSFDGGLGLLMFLTPKAFARIDAAIVFDREDRSGTAVSVWGTLPSISVGGTL